MPLLSSKNIKLLSVFGAFLALIFIYLHHFHNGFFADDPYFIGDNTAIRSLKNIPAIFTDIHTESSLPIYQFQYRPFFITSLAIDYFIANGVSPLVMHLHTFIGFVVLIMLSFLLNKKIFGYLSPAPFYPALLATCLFAFHPVTADVVNYLTARSNIFGTLYGMLYMVLWIYVPFFRKYYLYLIPLVIGCLFKIIAVMFVPLLWLYIIFFEYDTGFNKEALPALKSSFKTMLPSLLSAFITCLWIWHKSIPGAEGVGITLGTHLLTQAHVILRYFLLFLMPENINPYGSHPYITSPFDYQFITGLLFIIASMVVIYLFSLKKNTRVISFGLAWYFICLMPTSSIIPYAIDYVEYYMFATLIGLSMAMASVITLLVNHLKKESIFVRPVIIAASLVFLSTLTYGSHERVKLWGNEEKMFEDAIDKDPTNGHVLMNLGEYYMEKAKFDSATDYLNKAKIYWPNYDLIYLNLGLLAYYVSKDTAASDSYFQQGLNLHNWNHHQVCYFYASVLHKRHRDKEATELLQTALQEYPNYPQASDLLKEINSHNATNAADTTVMAINGKSSLTESDYVNLSFDYFNKGEYQKCIEACNKIIELDFKLSGSL